MGVVITDARDPTLPVVGTNVPTTDLQFADPPITVLQERSRFSKNNVATTRS